MYSDMKPITKVIIPVAGFGTRRLPITKVIEKCMLPVLDRPIVDYVVADCINAGITDICFVVGENSTQIREYYSRKHTLEAYLHRAGKESLILGITPPDNITFSFVVQPDDGLYGTALPVYYARDFTDDDERVLVCMGDDFLWNQDGSSELQRLIKSSEGSSVVGVEVERSEVGRYGVFDRHPDGSYIRIVEGPTPQDAPSNLINVSKYVLGRDVLRYIYEYCRAGVPNKKGEFFIIDPINTYVEQGGRMHVYPSSAEYFDGGTFDGWLHANSELRKRQLS
jgi:UTP--glucose-1-phosphate uridylyltransferase